MFLKRKTTETNRWFFFLEYGTQPVCHDGTEVGSAVRRGFSVGLDTALTRAAGPGFEPRYTDPESAVLPLDDPAIITFYSLIITSFSTLLSLNLFS